MGEYARKYTKGNVDELITLLNKAYADEWIAYYYYEVGAELVKTLDGKITADQLKEMAEDEEEHRKELAGNGDPVTFHVIRHILQEEMEHEEEVETLLGL